MVLPRFKALEQLQRDVKQVSQGRSGMIGRGRVLSVDLYVNRVRGLFLDDVVTWGYLR